MHARNTAGRTDRRHPHACVHTHTHAYTRLRPEGPCTVARRPGQPLHGQEALADPPGTPPSHALSPHYPTAAPGDVVTRRPRKQQDASPSMHRMQHSPGYTRKGGWMDAVPCDTTTSSPLHPVGDPCSCAPPPAPPTTVL